MASKECFHFTKLDRAYGIRDNGLQVRLEENSKSVGDTKPKISYSDSKIGAIGLFANFYEVYTGYKTGSRKPREDKPGEKEMYESILQSESFEEFLGNGMYLVFDGTGIENEGGNTGQGGIYDASTTTPIPGEKLKVGLVRNNDTGEISFSKYDYIHYLMSTLTQDEFSEMIPSMQERYIAYYQSHQEAIEQFRTGNFSQRKINIADFCRIFKGDIDKAIESNRVQDNTEMKPWELTKEELDKYNTGVKQVLNNQSVDVSKRKETSEPDLQL